jgi:transcriptional regulator with XRE-family HTH domain
MSTFGERLVEARKEAKLSQVVAAKKVHMSQSNLSELENDTYPTSRFTPQLAQLYGVTAMWLAEGKFPKRLADPAKSKNEVSEPSPQPYIEKFQLTTEETAILAAYRIMSADIRESWLLTAHATLARHQTAKKKTAA